MIKTYCGFIAIIGRPNVGKSTLVNNIMGEKISITSSKPQTTRHRIRAIKTMDEYQMVFIDTPGLHLEHKHQLNKLMNQTSLASMRDDADLIVFVIEALRFTEEDEWILEKLKKVDCPLVLLINKVDKIKDKNKLLPVVEKISALHSFAEVLLASAVAEETADLVLPVFKTYLQQSPHYFPPEFLSDRDDKFRCAEIVREKLMRLLGQELPYALAVEIEQIKHDDKKINIAALIWVERDGQKAIVIGKGGSQLKEVGSRARQDMEKLFNKKVFLQLWVKVKPGWVDNQQILKQLGYE